MPGRTWGGGATVVFTGGWACNISLERSWPILHIYKLIIIYSLYRNLWISVPSYSQSTPSSHSPPSPTSPLSRSHVINYMTSFQALLRFTTKCSEEPLHFDTGKWKLCTLWHIFFINLCCSRYLSLWVSINSIKIPKVLYLLFIAAHALSSLVIDSISGAP